MLVFMHGEHVFPFIAKTAMRTSGGTNSYASYSSVCVSLALADSLGHYFFSHCMNLGDVEMRGLSTASTMTPVATWIFFFNWS
jgi:hypothetical protein